jgi:hypothetical protein
MDWRLPTIEELESLVNLSAYETEHIGSSDILHWNGDLQVNGGLVLTGDRHWSSSPAEKAGMPRVTFWSFDFRTGRRREGFEDIMEGDTMHALCVRDVQRSSAPTKPRREAGENGGGLVPSAHRVRKYRDPSAPRCALRSG